MKVLPLSVVAVKGNPNLLTHWATKALQQFWAVAGPTYNEKVPPFSWTTTNLTGAGDGGESTENAIDRLAAVLERHLVAPQHTARLPSLTLPKLIKSAGDQIEGTNFFSFKKRCLQLFEEHNIGESIAVHLLQTEETLPKRFRQSLNNCTTVQACFTTMESMTEPLTAVYPQLLNELCSVESAFDNAEQIQLCDNVCRILLQMFFAEMKEMHMMHKTLLQMI